MTFSHKPVSTVTEYNDIDERVEREFESLLNSSRDA